jgi:hypothetical protein
MTGSLLLHVGFVDVRSFRSRNIRRILAGLLPSHGPTSQGKLDEAKGDYQQALDGYNTKKLYERNPDVVATRDSSIDRRGGSRNITIRDEHP